MCHALDGTDLENIELLRRDVRRSLADISRRVALSPPAVKRHIDRLDALGVITGYTVVVGHAKLGRPLEAFTERRFTGTTKVDEIAHIAAGIRRWRRCSRPPAIPTRWCGCASATSTISSASSICSGAAGVTRRR